MFIVMVAVKSIAADEQSIQFDAKRNLFLLQTDNSSYAFGLGKNKLFVNLHWGGKLSGIGDIPEPWESHFFYHRHGVTYLRYGRYEYPANFGDYFLEPCLKIENPDELVHLKLGFDTHKIQDNHLQVILKPKDYPLNVILHYEVCPEFDLINRWVEIQNKGDEKVLVENIQSAVWYVPHTHRYRLTHIAGNLGREWHVREEFLGAGEKVLESRTGISGHHHVPFFALDQDGLATEKSGAVWFGTLQWSGSWKMLIEQDPNEQVRVSAGYNDFDFALELAPGEKHSTPVFTAGFTKGGFGEASRILHRYQKKCLYPENMRDVEVPIVFNTFGTLGGSYSGRVTEENVMRLVPLAAELGVETFIIDAGWQTAVGEWTVHSERFPNGLKPVIDAVKKNGMQFGIWVEPEHIRGDAAIFKDESRKEWLFANTGKSAMLNLSRRDVLEYVYKDMSKLLRENDIDYFKLDFNRYFQIPDVSDRRTMRVRYIQNFYELFERLRKEFPDVYFENCASGAGRLDLKMDQYFARINRSDIQIPLDNLYQQEGFTYLHPAYMAGGASNMGVFGNNQPWWAGGAKKVEVPLQFSAHVAMMGWLSMSPEIDTLTTEQRAEIKKYFDLFKKIRHVTCHGEIHRLATMRKGPYAAFEFVLPDKSEALLFVFAHGLRFNQRIPNMLMESLDPDKVYDVEVHGTYPKEQARTYSMKTTRTVSGRALMESGVVIPLYGDYDSRIFHFKAN